MNRNIAIATAFVLSATFAGATGVDKAAIDASTPPGTDFWQYANGAWVKAHRQLSFWISGIVAVSAGLFIWNLSTQRRSEEIASRDLLARDARKCGATGIQLLGGSLAWSRRLAP